MSLNNYTKNSCFSANFYLSDLYENYPDKKTCINKENILFAASSQCVNPQIAKMAIRPGITV